MDRKYLLSCSALALCCMCCSVDVNGMFTPAFNADDGANYEGIVRKVRQVLGPERRRFINVEGQGLVEQVQKLVDDHSRLTQDLAESQRTGAVQAEENLRLQQLNSALQRAADAEKARSDLLLQQRQTDALSTSLLMSHEDRLNGLERIVFAAGGFCVGRQYEQRQSQNTMSGCARGVVPASTGTPLVPASHQNDSQRRIEELFRKQQEAIEQVLVRLNDIEQQIGAGGLDIATFRRELRASEERARIAEQRAHEAEDRAQSVERIYVKGLAQLNCAVESVLKMTSRDDACQRLVSSRVQTPLQRSRSLPSKQYRGLLGSRCKKVLAFLRVNKDLIALINELTLGKLQKNGVLFAGIFYPLLRERKNIDLFSLFCGRTDEEEIRKILGWQVRPSSEWSDSSKRLFKQIKQNRTIEGKWNTLYNSSDLVGRSEIFKFLINEYNKSSGYVSYDIKSEISVLINMINDSVFLNKFGLSAKSSFLTMIAKINKKFNGLLVFFNELLGTYFRNLSGLFKNGSTDEALRKSLYTKLVGAGSIDKINSSFPSKKLRVVSYVNQQIGGVNSVYPTNYKALGDYCEPIERVMVLCSSLYATDEEIALSLRQ